MSKSIFFKAITIIAAAIAALSFNSCSDDKKPEDNQKEDLAALKSVNASYKLNITQDILDFFDVTAVYGTNSDAGKTETITTKEWVKTPTYEKGNAGLPTTLSFKVTITPKKTLPVIDPEKLYSFKITNYINISGVRNDEQTTILNMHSSTHPNLTIKGEKVQKLIDKGTQTACSHEYTINSSSK